MSLGEELKAIDSEKILELTTSLVNRIVSDDSADEQDEHDEWSYKYPALSNLLKGLEWYYITTYPNANHEVISDIICGVTLGLTALTDYVEVANLEAMITDGTVEG